VIYCSNAIKTNHFWSGWPLAMKSGLSTTSVERDLNRSTGRLLRRCQRLDYTQRRSCSVSDGGLERSSQLWAAAIQPNDQFNQVLLTTGQIKASNRSGTARIGEQKGHCVSPGQRKTTCFFDDPTKIIGAWDVLVHPPYNPDLAPSDYHLFRSLQNNLNNNTFSSLDLLKKHLEDFFAQKPQDFYKRGIMKLVNRWQKIIK